MRIASLFEDVSLFYSESMLFVDNSKAKVVESNSFLNESVGSDDQVNGTGFELVNELSFLFICGAAGDVLDIHADWLEQFEERVVVLLGQYFCWGHECCLVAGFIGIEDCSGCNDGFSGSDISLKKS